MRRRRTQPLQNPSAVRLPCTEETLRRQLSPAKFCSGKLSRAYPRRALPYLVSRGCLCRFQGSGGRAGLECQRQHRRNPWRCHPMQVFGCPMARACRPSPQRASQTRVRRVSCVAYPGVIVRSWYQCDSSNNRTCVPPKKLSREIPWGGTHRASGGAPDGDHHVSPPCVLLHMARLTWQEESCREGQSGCEASRRTVIQCSPCAWRVRRMAGKACPPLVRVLAAMPAKALLALCRATARSESTSAYQQVGLDALNAAS